MRKRRDATNKEYKKIRELLVTFNNIVADFFKCCTYCEQK